MSEFNLDNSADEVDVVDTPDANDHLPEVTPDDVASKSGGEFQTVINEDSNAEEWGDFVEELMEPEQIELEERMQETPPSDEPVVTEAEEASSEQSPAEKPAVDTPENVEAVEGDKAVEEPSGIVIPEQPVVEAEAPQPATAEELQAVKGQYLGQLLKQYALSEDDAARFEANPAEVLPMLAANMHMKVMENVMQHVQSRVPNMIDQHTDTRSVSQQNETEFMTQWPELKDHAHTVAKVAQDWRKANPTASKEQAIKAVGFNTLVSLGVDPSQAAARLSRGFVEPVQSKPVAMKPHSPAGAGRTSVRQEQSAPSPNLWSEMVDHQEDWQQ